MSRHVAALEREVGGPLLLRTTRRLELTEAGRLFAEQARTLVRLADDARTSARPGALTGRLVLSSSVSLGVLRVLPRLAPFVAQHPRLDLDVRLEDREAELVGEGVDVALRAGLALPDTTSVVAYPITRLRRVLVAAPSYLARAGTLASVDDLVAHAAVRSTTARSPWRFLTAAGEHAVQPRVAIRVMTLLGVRAAAEAGLGVAVLPEMVVADSIASGRLRLVELHAKVIPDVPVHALLRSEARGNAKVMALVRCLQEIFSP